MSLSVPYRTDHPATGVVDRPLQIKTHSADARALPEMVQKALPSSRTNVLLPGSAEGAAVAPPPVISASKASSLSRPPVRITALAGAMGDERIPSGALLSETVGVARVVPVVMASPAPSKTVVLSPDGKISGLEHKPGLGPAANLAISTKRHLSASVGARRSVASSAVYGTSARNAYKVYFPTNDQSAVEEMAMHDSGAVLDEFDGDGQVDDRQKISRGGYLHYGSVGDDGAEEQIVDLGGIDDDIQG
jgi:hypothetical protein